MRRIYVLIGRRGSGKDTAAEALHGHVTRIAFADALKEYCAETYQIPVEYFHDVQLKDAPLSMPVSDEARAHFAMFCTPSQHLWTPRDILLLEGATKRAIKPDFWTKRALSRIAATPGDVIVTDCRFQCELDALQAIPHTECITIALRRLALPPSTTQADADAEALANNCTNPDYTIVNCGTKAALHNQMRAIVV